MMLDLSYQLYSSRNFPPLAETLSMISQLGYRQAEGNGGLFLPDMDPHVLRGMLDANDVSMTTIHIALEMMENEPDKALHRVKTLGCKAAFAPFLAPADRPDTAAGWVAFGKRLAEAGKPLQDAGIPFGWHNHDFEFARVDGEFVLDLILSASDQLKLQLDLAWVAVSGQDPAHWIEKHADRLISVHLKDVAPKGEALDEDGWADVGHGTLDWQAIMAALGKTNVAYHVIEHDNPNDHERFARRSLDAAHAF